MGVRTPHPSGPSAGANRATGWLLAVLLAAVLLVAALSGIGAANALEGDELIVEIDSDGDATVSLVQTFDLTTAEEREAFDDLAADEEAREALADRFERRMANVAANAGESSNREINVGGATVEAETVADGSVGVVTLSVPWTGLAQVDGAQLVVTAPFASGMAVDRPLTLVAPDGYTIEATPAPDERNERRATWEAGADLDGFEATMSAEDTTTHDQPGFGPVAAVLAVASLAIARRIRGRDERV